MDDLWNRGSNHTWRKLVYRIFCTDSEMIIMPLLDIRYPVNVSYEFYFYLIYHLVPNKLSHGCALYLPTRNFVCVAPEGKLDFSQGKIWAWLYKLFHAISVRFKKKKTVFGVVF